MRRHGRWHEALLSPRWGSLVFRLWPTAYAVGYIIFAASRLPLIIRPPEQMHMESISAPLVGGML